MEYSRSASSNQQVVGAATHVKLISIFLVSGTVSVRKNKSKRYQLNASNQKRFNVGEKEMKQMMMFCAVRRISERTIYAITRV